jgi:hypothetical protein
MNKHPIMRVAKNGRVRLNSYLNNSIEMTQNLNILKH